MARLGLIPLDRMTAEQRRLNDQIAGKRVGSQTRGPYGILLHHPALCEKVVGVADFLRDESTVGRPLVEIVVLTIARHWTSQYAWFAHARHADRFGLDPDMVEAIRTNRTPVIEDETQAIVYRMTSEMMNDRALSDETYNRAADLLGRFRPGAAVEPIVINILPNGFRDQVSNRLAPGARQSRKQYGHEQCDDADDHEQLDQGEPG